MALNNWMPPSFHIYKECRLEFISSNIKAHSITAAVVKNADHNRDFICGK